jgi:hypothetical protein
MTLAQDLNRLFRRFRQYEKEPDWVRLVMEGASAHAHELALFAVAADALELRASQNLPVPATLRFAAKNAAAFDAVLQSKEPITALRTPAEVGVALASEGQRAHLFPILNGPRVAAILFASSDQTSPISPPNQPTPHRDQPISHPNEPTSHPNQPIPHRDQPSRDCKGAVTINPDYLELIANMASSALERSENRSANAAINISVAPPKPTLPAWADMPPDQRALHSQAARFARSVVAEIQLAKPAACRTAREKGDLYVLLNKEIDKARKTYQKQFMTIPSMADYLHRELVTSLLGGDAKKLGADYPGEL